MKPDPFLQWLDEIEEDCRVEIINPYPERYERCLERSIKLTAALRKSYEANQSLIKDVSWQKPLRQSETNKAVSQAIQELHEIAGVKE